MSLSAEPTNPAETVELLQQLIRNACVNDGTPDSGGESTSAALLQNYLEGPGIDVERLAGRPGRDSVVARIEGSDPTAPTLLLMGHTDVVPANASRWRHDPFGGELIDGEVWGRGAVDMLNLTSSMAVATKTLARSGFRPRGTLIYLGVADEEAMGTWGADHLLTHEREHVMADYVLTESGGFPTQTASGIKLPVIVGEKGSFWCRLRIAGTPGHGSQPYRTDNALVTAADIVSRLAAHRPETMIHDTWVRFIQGLELGDELTHGLTTADGFLDFCEVLPIGLARQAHACTHTTISPNVVHGGSKTNVIPDMVEVELDIRTLPGQRGDDIRAMLNDVLGELAQRVEIVIIEDNEASASPLDTPLWDTLATVVDRWYPGAQTIPFLSVGGTDARFYRREGSVAYGFGLHSPRITFDQFSAMFHGDDERIDIESLRLSTEMFEVVAREILAAPTSR